MDKKFYQITIVTDNKELVSGLEKEFPGIPPNFPGLIFHTKVTEVTDPNLLEEAMVRLAKKGQEQNVYEQMEKDINDALDKLDGGGK